MREKISTVLILLLLILCLAGCNSKKDNINENQAEIDTLVLISNELKATDETLEKIEEIIEWQTKGADEDLEKLALANEKFELYDGASMSTENANEKYNEFSTYIDTIKKSQKTVNAIEYLEVEQINQTIDATQEYYDRLLNALEDLNSVFDFNRKANAIISEMGNIDLSSYESGAKATFAVYESISKGIEELKAVDCPAFMQQVFDKEIQGYDRLLAVIIEENSGYAYSDNMKLYAAENMYFRVNYESQQYRIDLLEDYNMQFKKVSERLEKRIKPIRNEISKNTDSLLKAMNYDSEGDE